MKKIATLVLLGTFALGISSCKKCATCTCGTITSTACVDEFDSKQDYNDALATAQNNGCDCEEKLEAN